MVSDEEKTRIEGFSECELYFAIDAIGEIIWRTNHDVGHGRYEMTPDIIENLKELSEFQQHCVQQLSKFGVDPESSKDRRNGDYWKWYHHWDNWKKEMDNDVWWEFDKKMNNQQDYSDMLPKHRWNEEDMML